MMMICSRLTSRGEERSRASFTVVLSLRCGSIVVPWPPPEQGFLQHMPAAKGRVCEWRDPSF
jgi:hypothetical protein